MKFTPSTFKFVKQQFGELITQKNIFWLDSSLILTKEEVMILAQITQSKDGILLYRATRDGFEASSFHEKCDGKAKTITIIKTKGNYVFGGYTAASWDSRGANKADKTAYLYSLRRNGVSNLSKYTITGGYEAYAIYCASTHGPAFGGGNDILIINRSDVNVGSRSQYSGYYIGLVQPLAEAPTNWLISEIEVYQIL